MNPYDFVHLTFLATGGEIAGRTKLQKTVYFLGLFTDSLNDLGYRAHFYGPYSDTVAAAVNRLKSLDFVTETTMSRGTVGPNGFEIARHDFKLTDDGRRIAEEKSRANPEAFQKLKIAVDRFQKAGDLDYMKMSVAAKTFFMLKESGKRATPTELSESAKALGWQVSPAEIAESITFLEKLGLVTTIPAA